MVDYLVDGYLIGFVKSVDWKGLLFIFFFNFVLKWRFRVMKYCFRGVRNVGLLEGFVLVFEVYWFKDGIIMGDVVFNCGLENIVCYLIFFIVICGNYYCFLFCGYWNMIWILEMFVKYFD